MKRTPKLVNPQFMVVALLQRALACSALESDHQDILCAQFRSFVGERRWHRDGREAQVLVVEFEMPYIYALEKRD
jgi:hypothetical protein